MKLHLITAAACLVAVSHQNSLGQGTIGFANSPTTLVLNNQTGTPVAQPAGQGVLLALYAGPVGTLENSLALVSTINATIGPNAGRFNSGEAVAVGGIPAGGMATFQVRAWDGNVAATWEQFIMVASPTDLRGVSALFNADTNDPNQPLEIPLTIASMGSGFTGLTLVPEPSTYALGAMGLGALAFLRRRKV